MSDLPITLDDVSVWLPGRGMVVNHLNATLVPGTITALVGRHGAGTTMVLRLLAGVLPAGSRIRGTALVEGHDVTQWGPDALASMTTLIDTDLLTVTDRPVGVPDQDQLVGLPETRPWSRRPAVTWPPDVRAVAATEGLTDSHRIVLLDHPTSGLTPLQRRRLTSRLRDLADAGATVVWADHDLDAVWSTADRVIEVSDGTVVSDSTTSQWSPNTLPLPVAPALAAIAGLPDLPPDQVEDLLPPAFHDLPESHPTERHETGPVMTVVRAADLGLEGPDLVIHDRECLAVVRAGDLGRSTTPTVRPESVVSRMAALLPRPARTLASSALAPDRGRSRRGRRRDLSRGERARLRLTDLVPSTEPLVIAHADHDLDPVDRASASAELAQTPAGLRLVTTRDVEFLVRCAHRVVLLDGNRIVADGSPRALDLAPMTRVGQLTGSALHLRLGDVLESLERNRWSRRPA